MHITRVRSTKLDSWSIEDSKILQVVGNKIANAYYEEGSTNKFAPGNIVSFGSSDERRIYIKRKYVDKAWTKKSGPSPVEKLKESGFRLNKKDLEEIYLDNIPAKNISASTNGVKANKKKNINFENMQIKKPKKINNNNNNNNTDLLDFDFDINPQKNQTTKNNFSNNKTISNKNSQDTDLLDFDFGFGSSNKVIKPQSNFSISKNNQNPINNNNNNMFTNNGNFNNSNIQNDKYNCLSFQTKPMYYDSNFPSNKFNSNTSWNNINNQSSNGNQLNAYSHKNVSLKNGSNQNLYGSIRNNNQTGIKDKYDVFDLCKGNFSNGFY